MARYFAAWVQASRVFSLTASITPVLLGTTLAWRDGFYSPSRLVLTLLGVVAIHIGTNLINDYYDHVNGIDSAASMGSSKVIQQGLLTAREVWWGGAMAFAVGAVAGLVLVHLSGWPILAIGLASLAAGYFYTAWPVALGYMALGELTVFIFMGPVTVLGAYYVAALRFTWQPLLASLPLAFLVAAILHANNVRDIDMDVLNHKLTLANLFGRRAANLEMVLLYVGAYAATLVAIVLGALPWLALGTAMTIGPACNNLRSIMHESAPEKLDRAVLASAKLHLVFGLLLIGSLLLARPFHW